MKKYNYILFAMVALFLAGVILDNPYIAMGCPILGMSTAFSMMFI